MFDIFGARADQLKILSRGTEGAAYARETTFLEAPLLTQKLFYEGQRALPTLVKRTYNGFGARR